jgi:hypothetical protein
MGLNTLVKQAYTLGENAMNGTHYATSPDIQGLIQNAVASLGEKLAAEAAHQSGKDDEEKSKKEKDACGPDKMAMARFTKEASALCAALDFTAVHLSKQANLAELPPGAGPVQASGTLSHETGAAHLQTPKSKVKSDGALLTTLEQTPGGGASQGSALSAGNSKAAHVFNLARKLANATGPGTTPAITDGAQRAPVAAGARPQLDSLIGSNSAATNFTKRDAVSNRKKDLSAYLTEPALNTGTDPVLAHSFAHNSEAGSKLSSAGVLKVAAQTALLKKKADIGSGLIGATLGGLKADAAKQNVQEGVLRGGVGAGLGAHAGSNAGWLIGSGLGTMIDTATGNKSNAGKHMGGYIGETVGRISGGIAGYKLLTNKYKPIDDSPTTDEAIEHAKKSL